MTLLASENDVTELSELQMHGQKYLLPLASISLGSASSKILLISANEKISVMWAQMCIIMTIVVLLFLLLENSNSNEIVPKIKSLSR